MIAWLINSYQVAADDAAWSGDMRQGGLIRASDGSHRGRGYLRKLQRSVVNRRFQKQLAIAPVVLRIDPRRAITLPRETVHDPAHVAGGKTVDPVSIRHCFQFLRHPRYGDIDPFVAHVVEQPTEPLGSQVRAQRP